MCHEIISLACVPCCSCIICYVCAYACGQIDRVDIAGMIDKSGAGFIIRTPLGPPLTVLFMEAFLLWRIKCTHVNGTVNLGFKRNRPMVSC